MKFVALLRGINAGKLRRVEMKKLKTLFESLGYTDVLTYINSGNIIFRSDLKSDVLQKEIESNLKKEFGFDVPVLVKTDREIQRITEAIPKEWKNDPRQRSDVAYLFCEIDSKKILAELPIKKEYLDIRYTKGAIYWNIDRKNYNKSQINKLIGHQLYQKMTVRNINTAQRISELMNDK